jgi:amino acid transporter
MTYRGMMQLTTIAFAVFIILIMLDQPRLGKWLDVFPLRIIGKYSYEIYLVMYPVIFLMNQKNRGETSKKIVFETLILIAIFAIVVHFAPIFVLTIAKRIEKRTGEKKFKRAFIAAMISLTFIFSFAQSAYVRANGGVDEVEEMKSLMSENEAMLEAKQNSMITLQASAAKVKNNVNKCVGLLKASVEQKTALNDQALKSAEESEPAEPVVPLPSAPANGVSAIGDSVMLGAAQNMMQTMPGIIIDAKVSRQVKAGIEIVRYLASHSALGSKVVIHLGTNGAPSVEACLELIDTIGPDREIY